MKGYIKLHRTLLDDHVFNESTPEQKTILITLMLMANHKENEWEWKGESYKVQPGQFITSLPKIAEKSGKGISVQNVRTALKRFVKLGFLTDESTNQNRLITIVNWAKYQSGEDEQTAKLTGDQQATNRQLTPNKNVKNAKNEEKKESSPRKKKIDYKEHHMKLAELLRDRVIENNKYAGNVNIEDWANEMRIMMEHRKIEGKDLQDVILFSQNDPFWKTNIQSANKLKDKFSRLHTEMTEKQKKRPNNVTQLRPTGTNNNHGNIVQDRNVESSFDGIPFDY